MLNALCHVTKTIMQPGSFVKALPIMNQSIENIESWSSFNLIVHFFVLNKNDKYGTQS